MALPKFLVKRAPKQKNIRRIRGLLDNSPIHTVCESAKCPNIGECFSQNTLAFIIMGNICSRNCRFCGVTKGNPSSLDQEEPARIAEAVKKLGLKYVVITSVTRDDIPDGGASHFVATIKHLNLTGNQIKIELLIPDFQGDEAALKAVLAARPSVLNHNLETAPRLYPLIRPEANYYRSLNLLKRAKKLDEDIVTKSGFMLGLGETKKEIENILKDLRAVKCNIVTIGQYLPPSRIHPRVARYVSLEEFAEIKVFGEKLGLVVEAGPFVRSSHQANETYKKVSA